MTLARSALVLLAITILVTSAFSATDDILGSWFNQDKDAKIEISKCGKDYCGKIVWLKEPVYPQGSKEGTPGTPKIDYKNPDLLKKFVTESGKILPRRVTGMPAHMHRKITREIKRSRSVLLMK